MYKYLLIIIILAFFSCNKKDFNQTHDNKTSSVSGVVLVADSLYELGKVYCDDSLNQEKAQSLFEQSFKLYEQLGNKAGMAKNYKWIGYTYDYLEEFEAEKKYLKKALEIYKELDNKKQMAIVNKFLGITYTITGGLDSALIHYSDGIAISEITRDTFEIIEGYQNIGICYRDIGDYEKALENHHRALKYCEELGYIQGEFSLYVAIAQDYKESDNNIAFFEYCDKALSLIDSIENYYSIASFYHTYASAFEQQGNDKKARTYHLKTLEISTEYDFKRGAAAAYSALALLELKEKSYKEAEKYADLSVGLEREIQNISGEIMSLLTSSQIQYEQKRYKKALEYIKNADKLSVENGLFDLIPDVYFHYYTIYKLIGNSTSALSYYEEYIELNDSLTGIEVKEKIANLEVKHETEKKQQQIVLLNKENENKKQKLIARNRLIVSLILILLVIIGIAYFFRQRGMQKLNRMESELQKYLLKVKDSEKSVKVEPELNSKEFALKYDLTDRELEVLNLISEGMPNAKIAEKTFVSTNTIKYHIKNIYLKLDVKNRVEALNKIKQ